MPVCLHRAASTYFAEMSLHLSLHVHTTPLPTGVFAGVKQSIVSVATGHQRRTIQTIQTTTENILFVIN